MWSSDAHLLGDVELHEAGHLGGEVQAGEVVDVGVAHVADLRDPAVGEHRIGRRHRQRRLHGPAVLMAAHQHVLHLQDLCMLE